MLARHLKSRHLAWCSELILILLVTSSLFVITSDAEELKFKKENDSKDDVKEVAIKKIASKLKPEIPEMDLGFVHAFVASISVIVVSELGDKTFFIAAIMAMRHSRLIVFAGAMGALGLMTVLSACLGYATTVIPRKLTFYLSSALFAIFGLKMLREGWTMSDDEAKEEYEEVQADLRKREDEFEKENVTTDIETGIIRVKRRGWLSCLPRIFIQSLTLTFLAEWGDRSQIATIILGAREEVAGVILGGCIGHALCTGLAVLGGRFIAQRISARTVHMIGGVVFLIFALSAFIIDPDEHSL
ncbi:transmembrane protein 165 [Lingula anatina]|uniref:GDT1 family protein n=1 Tax=Lingula anatina TaxID=7574 RepID=A0A1S3IW68_LINAN|nr:transmembrane protein 165 [Lingula anatina]|eukprot:XP_013402308.1 transmembrane protein 165 [Lingula anatina]